MSSFLDVNIIYPTIVGGICGYTGGVCGLIAGTLLGFEFYEDGPRWTNKKQLTSLYIGLGLGFVYGYKKFLKILLKKGEIFIDMGNWSDVEKYQFFRQMFYPDQNIIKQRGFKPEQKKSLIL